MAKTPRFFGRPTANDPYPDGADPIARREARFFPRSNTKLDRDRLPHPTELAGSELALAEDRIAYEVARPATFQAILKLFVLVWAAIVVVAGLARLAPGASLLHHRPATLILSAVSLLGLALVGSKPTALYRDFLCTHPKLTPKTRQKLLAKAPPGVNWVFVLGLLAVLNGFPDDEPSTGIILTLVWSALCILPFAGSAPLLIQRVLPFYFFYGQESSGAPGIWLPRETAGERARTRYELFLPLTATLAVALYLFCPWDMLRPELAAMYGRDAEPRYLPLLTEQVAGWLYLSFPLLEHGTKSTIPGTLLVLSLVAVVPGAVWLAVYASAMRQLKRLANDIDGTLDSLDPETRLKDGSPVERTPWAWAVDRLSSSRHVLTAPDGRALAEAEHLYLGQEPHQQLPLLIHRSIVNEHVYIVGESGSGKTSIGIMSLLLQLLRPYRRADGRLEPPPPMVIIDLKGDQALFWSVKHAVEGNTWTDPTSGTTKRQKFHYFSLSKGSASAQFNPFESFNPARRTFAELSELVLQCLNLVHGKGYGTGYYSATSRWELRQALEKLRPRIEAGEQIDFRDIAQALPRKPSRDTFHLVSIIQTLADIPQLLATQADPLEPQSVIWMPKLIAEREVAYFHLAAPEQSITASEIAHLAMFALVTTARDMKSDGVPDQPQAYAFLDEFQEVVSAGFKGINAMARSSMIGLIMASQTFKQLDKGRDGDFRELIRATTRMRIYFTVSSKDDAEDVVQFSGTEVGELTTRGTSMSISEYGVKTGTSEQKAEYLKPRITYNDLAEVTNDPNGYICHVTRGHGLTQFGGMPFRGCSPWPIPWSLFRERDQTAWPTKPERGQILSPVSAPELDQRSFKLANQALADSQREIAEVADREDRMRPYDRTPETKPKPRKSRPKASRPR